MKLLISQQKLNNLKSRDLAPLECIQCGVTFYLTKHDIQTAILKCGLNGAKFCSVSCKNKANIIPKIIMVCEQCGKSFKKKIKEIKKTKHNFCSKSCAARYHNAHKTKGTRRSKLEKYLEKQIETHYPELGCLYNYKSIIGSELDFYFPTLRLAIELNGIFHYEPIYGKDKLERIQYNDDQKAIRCNEVGIDLCIIDSSTCKYLNNNSKDKYWHMVHNVIKKVYKRHMPVLSECGEGGI